MERFLNSQRQVTPEVFQAIQDAKAAGVKVDYRDWSPYSRSSSTSWRA